MCPQVNFHLISKILSVKEKKNIVLSYECPAIKNILTIHSFAKLIYLI